jgi:hypothetical protein
MALRLRRGTNAERLAITPLSGELIFVTDYDSAGVTPVWIGDGVTNGGVEVSGSAGLSDIINDTTPQLGGTLDLNSFDITGTGNIDINGGIDIVGNLSATQMVADTVTATKFDGDLNGSIFADDSTVFVQAIDRTIVANEVTSQRVTSQFLGQYSEAEILNANFYRKETSPWPGGGTEFTKHNHGVSINGEDTTYWANSYSEDQYIIFPSPGGVGNYTQFFKIWNNGRVMINGEAGLSGFEGLGRQPRAELEVTGTMVVNPLAAPPASPTDGMFAVADGTTWDPASKGGSVSYPVYFDGVSWNALY